MTRLHAISIALLACVACAAGGIFVGYQRGKSDEYNRVLAASVKDFQRQAERVAKVNAAIADIGDRLRAELADSREHERASTTIVTRVVREHPEFAAVRRPAELQRVRRAQLERIAAAAAD